MIRDFSAYQKNLSPEKQDQVNNDLIKFFKRNIKNDSNLPDEFSLFKAKALINAKALNQALQSGDYDLQAEERDLNQLTKMIRSKRDVNKMISSMQSLFNLNNAQVRPRVKS